MAKSITHKLSEYHAWRALTAAVEDLVQERSETGDLPTFEELSKKFDIPLAKVEDLVDSSDNLMMISAIKVGGHVYEFKSMGEHQAEWVGDD